MAPEDLSTEYVNNSGAFGGNPKWDGKLANCLKKGQLVGLSYPNNKI